MAELINSLRAGYELGEQIKNAPQRNALVGMTLDSNRQSIDKNNQLMNQSGTEFNQSQSTKRAQIVFGTIEALEAIPENQRRQALIQAKPYLDQFNAAPPDIEGMPLDDASLNKYKASVQGARDLLTDPQRTPAAFLATHQKAIAMGYEPGTPEYQQVFRVDQGLAPSMGNYSAQERIAGSGMTGQVAASQGVIKGAESGAAATAKLQAEGALKPEIEADITEMKARAEQKVDTEFKQKAGGYKLEDAQSIYDNLSNSELGLIYGREEQFVPDSVRGQEGIDLMAQRDQLVGMIELGAASELKGQGSITENERAILRDAVTILKNKRISPSLAKIQLDRAMRVLMRNAGKATGDDKAGSSIGRFKIEVVK